MRVQLGLKQKPKPDDVADALAAAITCGFLYREDEVIMTEKFSNTAGMKRTRRGWEAKAEVEFGDKLDK